MRAQSTVRLLRDEQRGKREQRKTVFAQAASGVPGLSARLQALTAALGQVGGATGARLGFRVSGDMVVPVLAPASCFGARALGVPLCTASGVPGLSARLQALTAALGQVGGATGARWRARLFGLLCLIQRVRAVPWRALPRCAVRPSLHAQRRNNHPFGRGCA